MEEFTKLAHYFRRLSLMSKNRSALECHLGMKSIIHLAEKNGTFAALEKNLIEIGAEHGLSNPFIAYFLRSYILPMKASMKGPSRSSSEQDELELKSQTLLTALSNVGPRAEVNEAKNEYIVNEEFVSSNKKQSANAKASSDKIDEQNEEEKKSKQGRKSRSRSRDRRRHKSRSQDRKERRSHRSRTRSRSRTRHRSCDRGCVSAEIRCQEKLKKKDAAMDTPSNSRVIFDEEGVNGMILCGKHLPNEMLLEIFRYADYETLLSCQLVCKRWRILIGESKVWHKKRIKEILISWLYELAYTYTAAIASAKIVSQRLGISQAQNTILSRMAKSFGVSCFKT